MPKESKREYEPHTAMRPHEELDERFAKTAYLVEADDFAYHCLWKENHERYEWKQHNNGIGYHLGELDHRPVYINCQWAEVGGQLMLFYTSNSQVTDWDLVEKFVKYACPHLLRDETADKRWHKVDAMNFHNALGDAKRKEQEGELVG